MAEAGLFLEAFVSKGILEKKSQVDCRIGSSEI
jgi:hypothetical protein